MSQAKYDQRTEQHIASLQSDFADRVRQWLAQCRQRGLNPYIHFGSRSVEEQRKLPQKFLAGGLKATEPEHSYHCYGRAFDCVNITNPDSGMPVWPGMVAERTRKKHRLGRSSKLPESVQAITTIFKMGDLARLQIYLDLNSEAFRHDPDLKLVA